MEGPSVLILGGVGFLGRNLVKYLRDNKLAGFIRVCDKAHWKTSNMNQAHTEAFNDTDLVEFKQADLTKDSTLPCSAFSSLLFFCRGLGFRPKTFQLWQEERNDVLSLSACCVFLPLFHRMDRHLLPCVFCDISRSTNLGISSHPFPCTHPCSACRASLRRQAIRLRLQLLRRDPLRPQRG